MPIRQLKSSLQAHIETSLDQLNRIESLVVIMQKEYNQQAISPSSDETKVELGSKPKTKTKPVEALTTFNVLRFYLDTNIMTKVGMGSTSSNIPLAAHVMEAIELLKTDPVVRIRMNDGTNVIYVLDPDNSNRVFSVVFHDEITSPTDAIETLLDLETFSTRPNPLDTMAPTLANALGVLTGKQYPTTKTTVEVDKGPINSKHLQAAQAVTDILKEALVELRAYEAKATLYNTEAEAQLTHAHGPQYDIHLDTELPIVPAETTPLEHIRILVQYLIAQHVSTELSSFGHGWLKPGLDIGSGELPFTESNFITSPDPLTANQYGVLFGSSRNVPNGGALCNQITFNLESGYLVTINNIDIGPDVVIRQLINDKVVRVIAADKIIEILEQLAGILNTVRTYYLNEDN